MNTIAIAAGIGLIAYIAHSTGMLGGDGGETKGSKPGFNLGNLMSMFGRAGGIVGSQGVPAPTIYNLPAQAGVTFPAPATMDFGDFFRTSPPGPDDTSTKKEIIIYGELTTPAQERYIRDPHFSHIVTEPGKPKEIVIMSSSPTGVSPRSSSTKKEVKARAATPGKMGYGKSYAKAHGLGGD